DIDHDRRRNLGVERRDQLSSTPQHRTLVDRAFMCAAKVAGRRLIALSSFHNDGVFSGVTLRSMSLYKTLPSTVFTYLTEPAFEPSLIGWPTTVILSPALKVRRVQPWRCARFGPAASKSQVPAVRASFAPFGTC